MSSNGRISVLAMTLLTGVVVAACQRPAETPPPAQPVESAADKAATVAEANKAVVNRFFDEVVTQGKIEVIDELVDSGFVEHMPLPPGTPGGLEGLKGFLTAYRQAFPDASVTVEQILAEGDLVAVRSIWKGTQKGEWMGVKPTNQAMEFEVYDIVRLKDGKATDHWGMDDTERKMKAAGDGK